MSPQEISNLYYAAIQSSGQWREIQLLSTRALSKLPRDYPYRHYFYCTRAGAYDAQGKHGLALADSRRAIEQEPNCPESLFIHAMNLHTAALDQAGSCKPLLRRAIKCLEKVTALEPASTMPASCKPVTAEGWRRLKYDSCFLLGFVYLDLGKFDEAKANMLQYINAKTSTRFTSRYQLRDARETLGIIEAELATL